MVTIYTCQHKRNRKLFEKIPQKILKQNPFFTPLLPGSRSRISDPSFSFHCRDHAAFFLAKKDGVPAGRIAAFTSPSSEHTCFGFFDFIDDIEVSRALWDAAARHAAQLGKPTLFGPFDPIIGELCGLLIEGFETAASVESAFNPPYYLEHFERLGMVRSRDLASLYFSGAEIPKGKREALALELSLSTGLTVREVDPAHWERELPQLHSLLRQAHKVERGAMLLDLDRLRSRLEMLDVHRVAGRLWMLQRNSQPMGFAVLQPNTHEQLWATRDEASWLRRWKLRCGAIAEPREARLTPMVLHPEIRSPEAAALLYLTAWSKSSALYLGGEFSWSGEFPSGSIQRMTLLGARCYKKYRIYERSV